MASSLALSRQTQKAAIIRFPDKVKCSVCEKNLMAEKFSNRQKQDYLSALKKANGKQVSLVNHPKCTKCTGQQRVEMTCKFCDITKGLDEFSKNQRNNPDNARCWDCCQNHLEELPGTKSIEAEKLKDHGAGTSYYTQSLDMELLSSASKKLSLSETKSNAESTGSSAFANVDEDTYDEDNDAVWVDQTRARNTLPTVHHMPSTFTAYDSSGAAHQRSRSPSIASSVTGTDWDKFSVVERASRRSTYTGSTVSSSDRFAKVRPPALSSDEIEEARAEREKKAEQRRNEAVDDDDDYDSDSDGEMPY